MAISLASLTRVSALKPPRILIHGVHGVGKTTFAAGAPDPVFVLTEDGLGTLDVPHFRQWHVQAHGKHFGGSLDGVGLGVPEAPKTWHVLEFKTHNAKSFAELRKHGVRRAKPEHWAQMQVYLHLTGLSRALYLAVCKDTDALYAERVRVDHEAAERLIARAGRIIFAARPPARISDDPDWFQCRLCPHADACHDDRLPLRTCRSCLHVTPTPDGAWHCARFDRRLSANEQRAGCRSHLFIPDLVQGEQFDADLDGAWVAYRKPDGSVWRDGAA